MSFLITFILSFFALWLLLRFIRYRHKKWNEYIENAGKFNECARQLVNDDNVSESALEYIYIMNETIDSKNVAYLMLLSFKKNKTIKASTLDESEILNKYVINKNVSEAEKLRIFLHLSTALNYWISAITSRSPLFGFFLKAEFAEEFSRPEKMEGTLYKARKGLGTNKVQDECFSAS